MESQLWFFLALASALLYSFRGILEKHLIKNINKYVLGFAIRFFALPFFFLPFFFLPDIFIPLSELPAQFWLAVIILTVVSTPLETIFYYKAIKEEEVSLVLPILSLSPVITLIFSTIILKEFPTLWGVIGVLLIIFGIYALKLGHAREGIWQPFHHLKNNRGVRLMSVVLLSYGLGSVFDKMGVANSNAYMFALANYIGVSCTLFAITYLKAKTHLKELFIYKKYFLIIGFIVAGYTLLYMLALETSFATYAIAVRSTSVLFTIILAYHFFKEKDLIQKAFAAVIIVLGLICIKIFG